METPKETLSLLEAAERLALECWRGARSAESLALSGLNSERAVRERLETFRRAALHGPKAQHHELAPCPARRAPLEEIDFARHPTLTIRLRVEMLLASCFPARIDAPTDLLEVEDELARFALRCYLAQSVAARLGWWTARGGEVRDARIAKALYGELSLVRWTQYRGLIEASEELYRTARWRESARSALEADRLVRTTAALLRASAALTKSGEFPSALWCVRASLLEPRSTFESLGVAERARNLEARLSLLVESPSPSGAADAESLAREEPMVLRASKAAAGSLVPPSSDDDAKAALLSVAGTPDMSRSRDPRRAPTTIESARRRKLADPEPPIFAPAARHDSVLDHPIVADLHLGLVIQRVERAGRSTPRAHAVDERVGALEAARPAGAARAGPGDDEPTEAIAPSLQAAPSSTPRPRVSLMSTAAHEETERIRDRVRGGGLASS